MKSFEYISDLRSYVPGNDESPYAFFEPSKDVYVWIGGEWVKKKYFDTRSTAQIIGHTVGDVRNLLACYNPYFVREKRQGSLKLTYGHVLKMKLMIDARKQGVLHDMIMAGKIENIYGTRKEYHAL